MAAVIAELDKLRSIVQDAIAKNLYRTGILFGETLISSNECTISDIVLYAKCHLDNGQPRQCLSILERKGLLSNHTIFVIQSIVNPFPALILTGDDFTAEHKSNNQNVLVADSLRAVYIAAQCLFLIGQYEDSINLLNPLLMIDDNESVTDLMTEHYNSFTITNTGISQISALYCLVGKCYFALDNRAKSSSMLLMSLKIDMTCLESLDFIAEHGLLNETAAVEFYNQSFNNNNCSWLKVYYRNFLNIPCERTSIENNCVSASCLDFNDDGPELSRKAGVFFRRNFIENAYQVSKRAYFLDPHNNHCLSIYVASLVQLKQLTELFYLAHELVNSFPKSSMSWYTIGCYYWCCAQMDIARSYFCKSTQIDKRNVNSWVMLGHVLSHQEENEQAISAYRTAIRLLPDNFLPMLFIARELLRANYDRLALQILVATLKFSNSHDLTILNEIGVAYFKLNNFSDALSTLSDAIGRDFVDNFANNFSQSRDCEIEMLSNFAVLLRKTGHFVDSLFWFNKCLSLSPGDFNCFIDIGFTLHLMRRFEDSICAYHKALALQPSNSLCHELLNLAVEDVNFYEKNQ